MTAGAVFAGVNVSVGAALAGAAVSTGAVFAGTSVSVDGTLVGAVDSTGAGLGFSTRAVLSDPGISDGAAVSGASVCEIETEGASLSAILSAVQAVRSRIKAIIKIRIRLIYHPALFHFMIPPPVYRWI